MSGAERRPATARRRIALTPAEVRAVNEGRFVRVELGAFVRVAPGLRTRSAFVGRAGGRAMAFANLCQHNPVPLDLPDDPAPAENGVRLAPMADDGAHLMCHSHGALYRPSDGQCVLGPCYGQRLFALAIEDAGGALVLTVDA